MPLLKWLDKNLEKLIMRTALALICVVLMFQVIMRYCLGNALAWPEEFSRLCFIVASFYSVGYCIRYGLMLRVELLVNMMPGAARRFFTIFAQLCTLALFSFMAWSTVDVVMRSRKTMQLTTALRVPMYAIYAVVGVAFAIAALRAAQSLIAALRANTNEANG